MNKPIIRSVSAILRRRLDIRLISSSLLIMLSVISCTSKPQLHDSPKVTFDDQLRNRFDFYIGTLEGCVVGSNGQPIQKLKVSADLEDFINISAQPSQTDDSGCYAINLFWKEQPYLLAQVFPNPAANSFTDNGIPYLQSARTVNLDIPIVVGDKGQALLTQEVTVYSVSYILKQIADDIVLPRLRSVSFSPEDYTTGYPVVGAEVTLKATSPIPTVDSLLSYYVSQANLRKVAGEAAPSYILDSETKIQKPKGFPQFIVLNYSEYQLSINHPNYHSVEATYYIENGIDKIIRMTPKDQKRRIDIIDR